MGTTPSTGSRPVASGNTGYGESADFGTHELRRSDVHGSAGASAGAREASERSSLLANNHYLDASGLPQTPTHRPVMAMSKDEVLDVAAALAEEAKPEARTDSSVVRPVTCSNEPHVVAMRKVMKKGDCQALRDMVVADPFLLVSRDMVFWRTPLHVAAASGKTDVVLILLQAGADVLLEDKYGETPYDLAKRYRHSNTASLLREATKAEKARRREATKLGGSGHAGKRSRGTGSGGKRNKGRKHGRSKSDGGKGVSANGRRKGAKGGGRGKHGRSKSHAAAANGLKAGPAAALTTIDEVSGEIEHKGVVANSDSEGNASTGVDAAAPPSEAGQPGGRAGSSDSAVGVVRPGAPVAVATLTSSNAPHSWSKAEDPRGARPPTHAQA